MSEQIFKPITGGLAVKSVMKMAFPTVKDGRLVEKATRRPNRQERRRLAKAG